MIAEIHHKISNTGSNLNERLEDELTGNFFGNMRYIPFKRGLGKILGLYAYDDDNLFQQIFTKIAIDEWKTEFWKRSDLGLGEIDCYMSEIEEVTLGIEVKYRSDLSSEDQLEREASMMKEWSENNKLFLLFVAPRRDYCRYIFEQNKNREKMKGVTFGYLTWEDALLGLEEVETQTNFEKLIIEDLKRLLVGKGFGGFHGFSFEQEEIIIDKTAEWFCKQSVSAHHFKDFLIPEPEIGEKIYEFRKKH